MWNWACEGGGASLLQGPDRVASSRQTKILWENIMEEAGEQCTVVFALIVTELAIWVCVRVGGGGFYTPPTKQSPNL
jgi:hypothetical protein